MSLPNSERQTQAVSDAIVNSDYLLIVAAAGLSISTTQPNNPYHSDADFARHYPRMAKQYGYKNAYMAMGLAADPNVPPAVKSAFGAKHRLNMIEYFPPTEGYTVLREMAMRNRKDEKSVFCWTSNVDRCFSRSGFPSDRVYTSQGEMHREQCVRCGLVWDCQEEMKKIVEASGGSNIDLMMELQDPSLDLKCPKCGLSDQLFPNLRGGDWFDHSPYLPQQEELIKFLSKVVDSGCSSSTRTSSSSASSSRPATFTVVEIGVGPNTPVVTALPASRFAMAAALNGVDVSYVRINPDPRCEQYSGNPARTYEATKKNLQLTSSPTPGSLVYTCLPTTWEVLIRVANSGSSNTQRSGERTMAHKDGVSHHDSEATVTKFEEHTTQQSGEPSKISFSSGGSEQVFQSAIKMLHNLR